MSLPQVNATLTAITAAGTSDDYDTPAGVGAAKWEGAAGAYVTERVLTGLQPGRVDRFRSTQIVIPGDLSPRVELAQGDTVAYRYAGAARTGRVLNFEAHLLAGVTPTVRVSFENA